jgi:hypothetical protein
MADIVNKFQGAERFTKLDLKEAYHQFVLDEQSRNITTFYGPDGLYLYKRLNYGTKSTQDTLQLEMHKMLSGIPSQVNIADDILIGGSVEEHDAALQKVLSALTSNGITVNPDKCVFDVEEVRFVGLVINKQGIKPNPKNVKNLQDASQPTSKVELRSFLGMAWFRNAPNANITITAMEKIFTNKGVPAVCQSDNGLPFQSKEMEQFAQSSKYRHHHITPEWPRANGTVERFNWSMKKALQAATLEGKSLRDASQRFLQMYRSTPHSTTGVSPHAALHGGREIRTVLPLMTPTNHVIDCIRDQRYKAKMRNGLRPHELRVGDSVIVKQTKVNKLTPTFNPTPLRITEVQGSTGDKRRVNHHEGCVILLENCIRHAGSKRR